MNPIAEKARAFADKIASIPLRDVLDQMSDELDRLAARVAELEKGPAVLVQERGPYWHAFESSDDAEAFYQDPSSPGILVKHVASWTHHPASKPEPEASV